MSAQWEPGRVKVCQVRTYCPTLTRIVFWQGVSETIWRYDEDGGQWKGQPVPGPRYAQRESLWRDF